MTNDLIWKTALEQSGVDAGCDPADFQKTENVIVLSKSHPDARRYLELPFDCNLISYGSNIVASVSAECKEIVGDYISRYPAEHCFETPNLLVLNDALEEKGLQVCFMAEYFLPDVNLVKPLHCGYELRVLHPEDFADLYKPEWSNALCEKRKHLDVLGVGAYHGETLVGFAGCSADCENMWQIGVDVLPEYRRQGIASAVTSCLAVEVMNRGKIPFYCAAWSNVKSVRNAIRCGFHPAWVELTAKPRTFVEQMNR